MHASQVSLRGTQRVLFALLLLPLLVSCEAIWGGLSRQNFKNCVAYPGNCKQDVEYCHPERETCVPFGPSCGVGQPPCEPTGPDQICYEHLGRCATNVILDTVEPPLGPASGGIPITINGRYFRNGIKVFFDQHVSPHVEVVHQGKLVATLPSSMGRLGPSIVRLVQADGGETERSGLFSYNVGQVNFSPLQDATSTLFVDDLALTDLNQDGVIDLAAYGNNSLFSVIGDGTGYFANLMPVSGYGKLSGDIAFGDINGDGFDDLIAPTESITNPDDGVLIIFMNNGQGKLEFNSQIPLGSKIKATRAGIGDLDADGKVDLLVAIIDGAGVHSLVAFRGLGFGRFSSTASGYAFTQPFTFQQISNLRMLDLNNDAAADFVVSGKITTMTGGTVNGVLAVVSSKVQFPASAFERVQDLLNFPSSVFVSDLNQDKIPDIIASVDVGTNNAVYVLIGAGGGMFNPPAQYQVGSAHRFTRLISGDFDGDDNLDILLWDARVARVRLLLGSPVGVLRPQDQDFLLPGLPSAVKARDVNGDGLVDLAVAFGGLQAMQVYVNSPRF